MVARRELFLELCKYGESAGIRLAAVGGKRMEMGRKPPAKRLTFAGACPHNANASSKKGGVIRFDRDSGGVLECAQPARRGFPNRRV